MYIVLYILVKILCCVSPLTDYLSNKKQKNKKKTPLFIRFGPKKMGLDLDIFHELNVITLFSVSSIFSYHRQQ